MSVIADLIRAGVDPDLVAQVAAELVEAARSAAPVRTAEPRRLDVTGLEWARIRHRVLERDGYVCTYCKDPDSFECDHVVPRSRGGLSTAENLVAACKSCNSSKGARLLSEWARP